MCPVLVADRLSKRYGARLAVDEVSFTVEAGEVMGLLGPNGSGKTTVLRLLTGYLHPSSGTARIAGFDVVEAGLATRRYVGYVPEDVPLYSHMRVDEFLAFMGRLKGLSGRPLRDGVASVCQRLHLSDVRSTAIEMRELIRTLATTHTIVVTSHILSEIEKIAHRVAILLDGRLCGVHVLGGP